MNSPQSPRPKPVHEIRFGTLKAAVWRNETENGHRFNTTFSKSYKDGEQWHNTDSFGRDDLLVIAKLADHAHSWIHSQARENPVEQSPAPAPAAGRAVPSYSRNRPRPDAD